MARALRQYITHRRALIGAVVVLSLTALAPSRFGAWARQPAGVFQRVVAPVQQVASMASRWLGRRGTPPEEAVLQHLEQERDQWRSMFRASELELQQARERLKQFETGALAADRGVRYLTASVIGSAGAPGTDLLRIRAGTRDRVYRGTVAVAAGAQLAGRLENVGAASSTLVLITQRGQPLINGVIPLGDGPGTGAEDDLSCQLAPFGDGTLRGMVEYKSPKPGEPARTAAVGQYVYLKDPSWPRPAQMLVLGRVERLSKEAFDSPLRQIVTVRPLLRLDWLTEVVLRVVEDDAPPGAGGAP